MRIRVICVSLVVCLFTGMLSVSCNKEHKSSSNSPSPSPAALPASPTSSPSAATPPPAPAGTAVSASDLVGEFAKDAAAATSKYDGKTLTVSGTVSATNTKPNADGFLYLSVTLAGPTQGDGSDYHVLCNLPSDEKSKVEPLKTGDSVKLTGKFADFDASDKKIKINMCTLSQ